MLESMDGGDLEDVVISNLTMRKVVAAPIFLRLGARMRSPEGRQIGHLRRVRISDINVYDSDSYYGVIIAGLPGHCIQDVSLRNLNLGFRGGLTPADALKEVPEGEKLYPDPWMFGGFMPAKGFFLRHVDGLEADRVHFSFLSPDTRPLVLREDASHLVFSNITEDGKPVKIR